MNERYDLRKEIAGLDRTDFDSVALKVYRYQYATNPLYKKFVELLKKSEDFRPTDVSEIPFLPISFFKTHQIQSGVWKEQSAYKSSATTGMTRSTHFVRDDEWYLSLAQKSYEEVYGPLSNQVFFALLPGYIERGDSSLVAMAAHFIKETSNPLSGFYLHDFEALLEGIKKARESKKQIVLLGVSYALYQLAGQDLDFSDLVIMETGGMKGIGPEMPKLAFHDYLRKGMNLNSVHSEYGMTELLSQAYSVGNGIFNPSGLMDIYISELTDPLSWMQDERGGVVNVIDLANLDTCSFIQTEDMGIRYDDGSFQLLGRVDAAEIRGCNLLASDLAL